MRAIKNEREATIKMVNFPTPKTAIRKGYDYGPFFIFRNKSTLNGGNYWLIYHWPTSMDHFVTTGDTKKQMQVVADWLLKIKIDWEKPLDLEKIQDVIGGRIRTIANEACCLCYEEKGSYMFKTILESLEKLVKECNENLSS